MQVSHISGTACTLQSFAKGIHAVGAVLPSVGTVITGASPLSTETVATMTRLFSLSSLRTCYGLTEAGGPVTITPRNEIASTNLGFPAAMVQLKVGPFLCTQDCFAYCIRLVKEAEYIFNKRARVATFIYDMPRTNIGECILH